MITFIFGLMVGVVLGIAVASICAVSGRVSEEELPELDAQTLR